MITAPPVHDSASSAYQDWEGLLPDSATRMNEGQDQRTLDADAARALWREAICSLAEWPVALPPDSWPARILSSPIFAEWRGIWKQDPGRAFDAWLHEALPWAGTTPAYFTASADQTIETTWGAFCRGWRHFLLEAEDAILWSPREALALRFLPTGMVYVGGRFWPEKANFPTT